MSEFCQKHSTCPRDFTDCDSLNQKQESQHINNGTGHDGYIKRKT